MEQDGQLERGICVGLIDVEMDFLSDLWKFMRERKKFWLIPMITILLLLGILLVLGGGSAIAPFIYTLF
jgi:hypothetical protein